MMAEDVNPHPHNFISVNSSNEFLELFHHAFNLPEKFDHLEIPYRYTKNGKEKYMDYIKVSNPDGDTITRQTSINVEFEAKITSPEKKKIFMIIIYHQYPD